MPAHAIGVLRIGTAAVEIALIAVKRLADRNRAVRVIGAGLTACQRPRHVDCLPVGQDVLAIGGFKIVGQSNAFDPIGAVAVGTAYAPGTRPGVAPVAQADAGADRRPNRLLPYFQATAGSRSFELAGARLRHLARPPSVHKVSARAERNSMARDRAPRRSCDIQMGWIAIQEVYSTP